MAKLKSICLDDTCLTNTDHVELTQAEYDALTPEEKTNGTVYFVTDGEGGGGTYILPPATASTLGGVKVGSGLSVESDGTLSAETDGIFYITVDAADFTPSSDPNVMEMELTTPYTLSELNAILQSENPKTMVLRVVSTTGNTKTINEVMLNNQSPSLFEGDLLYTQSYMRVSHSYAKITITSEGGRTMLRQQAGGMGTVPAGGAQGQVLVKQSATDYDTAWQTVATAEQVKEMLLALAPPKSFADCTWEEAELYLEWHKQGIINIYDFWHMGDEKVIELSAFSIDNTNFPAKNVSIMLVGTDQRRVALSEDADRSIFVWQFKYVLDAHPEEPGGGVITPYGAYIGGNSTNTYKDTYLASTLNTTVFNALPEGMRNLCMEQTVRLNDLLPDPATYTGKCMLPSAKEVLGTNSGSQTIMYDEQFDYYVDNPDKAFYARFRQQTSGPITPTKTCSWLRSRPLNSPTQWSANNQGALFETTYSSMYTVMPTGAFR